MDPHTITLYSIASALSFSLCLVLLAFSHFQRVGTVTRGFALSLLVLALAFFMAGHRPVLPDWTMVLVSNLMLLSSGSFMYIGLSAYCEQRRIKPDWQGLVVLAMTVPLFWYWGLIEPNGINRSVVFSFACAVINVRTAMVLHKAWRQKRGIPLLVMGGLFGILTVWMLFRGIYLLYDAPPPAEIKGANPTTWITVFWYNVLASIMSAVVMWMELHQLKQQKEIKNTIDISGVSRSNQILLWSTVTVLCIAIASEVGISYAVLYAKEKNKQEENAVQINETFVQHTVQLVNEVDVLLRAMRGFYQKTHSVKESERYMDSLGFDREQINNIYLISPTGHILIPWSGRHKNLNVSHRDYFRHHKNTDEDKIYIDPVQKGQVTGKMQFRITRRISNADGSFGGVVVAPIEPSRLADYYSQLVSGKQNVATLLGTMDHKIRARVPLMDDGHWAQPLDSPLWQALEKSAVGRYEHPGAIDGIQRQFFYKQVGDLPLVMVNAFSDSDVRDSVLERIRPIAFGAALTIATILTLATILTTVIRRRDEQEQFMSMLSHELKTPLAVIRMLMGSQQVPVSIKERIARAITEMNAILERCVQADRLDHGSVSLTKGSHQVTEILDNVKHSCANPDLVLINSEKLPMCNTDAQLIGIVLSNLVDNALKYGAPDRHVVVSATPQALRKKLGVGIQVMNEVGPVGVPDPEKVFRKYYRSPAAHGNTGSGLGLHIAAGLAQKLGGKLSHESTTERVTFSLWIPC